MALKPHQNGAMKVLHLIPSLVVGGAERQLANLANAMCDKGMEVHLGFVHGGPNLDYVDQGRVHCHHVPSSSNHDPLILVRLARLIRQLRPAVVQTWLPQMDVLGGAAAYMCKVPHVLSERCMATAYPNTWKNALRRRIGRRACAIVANSAAGAEYWNEQRAQGRTLVIRNGIVPQQLEASVPGALSTHGLRETARLLLFGGRFCPQKNIDVMVESLRLVLDARSDCCALLFGTGPLLAKAQATVRQMGLEERIKLPAYTASLLGWMRRADVFISVSHFEGHPNTVIEAMAVGCPLLVSAIPAHREVLDESTASFCNPASAPEIAQALLKLLDDTAGAQQRAAAARERALSWSIEDAASAYLRLYESVR